MLSALRRGRRGDGGAVGRGEASAGVGAPGPHGAVVLRVGWPAPVHAAWVFTNLAASLAVVMSLPSMGSLTSLGPAALGLAALGTALHVLFGGLLASRAARLPQGARGRMRLRFAAAMTRTLAAGQAALAALVAVSLPEDGRAFGLDLRLLSELRHPALQLWDAVEVATLAHGMAGVFRALAVVTAAALALQVLATTAGWGLLSERARRLAWDAFDVPLFVSFGVALWVLPFTPRHEGDDPTLPAIALSIATLFTIRALARVLPPALGALERAGFQALVSARMLRARKSGFLTVIGMLSVLAVSFSSCTLTTTLSVMGGFREDLQRKILGNNAHVVIDRQYGTWEGWAPVLERVRGTRGVVGASPFVEGEVMVTSASNLGGAELRGIDPRAIGEVTDLPRNMRHGRLDYLLDPEQLLHLGADEMSGSILGAHDARLPLPDRALPSTEGPLELGDAGMPDAGTVDLGALPLRDAPLQTEAQRSLMRQIDEILGQLEPEGTDPLREGSAARLGRPGDGSPSEGRPRDDDEGFLRMPPALQSPREVLPGLVVGQELARSLRLHVGDEVNVVSPRGDLGPSGPVPRSRPFRVAGIFYSGMYEYDMKVAYTDLATAQRFLSAGDAISGIEVKLDDWERAELAAAELRQALGRDELRVRSWQEVNRNLFGALELEKLAMFITLGIAILVASFCIIGTLVLMVQEKGREVGILKAMGASDRQIVGVFMLQGLFIGVVGAASGLGLGWVVCFAAEHYGIIQLNPEVYYIDRLPIHASGVEFVVVGVAAVVVCLLATIYPAILGSRLRPVDALRYA